METLKLSIPEENVNYSSSYEKFARMFDGELRNFTDEEKDEYKKILDSIYKPTGINIFDLSLK